MTPGGGRQTGGLGVRLLIVYAILAAALLLWMAIPTPSSQAPALPEFRTQRPALPDRTTNAGPKDAAERETGAEPQTNASAGLGAGAAPKASWSKEELQKLFAQTAEAYELPADLLIAIAQHESRFSPWALNLGGQGFFPETRAQATQLLSNRASKNFDLGIMQVNSQWLDHFDLTPEQALEPDVNIQLGARILKQCVERYGLSWDALSAYHTGGPGKHNWRASIYALQVWRRYEKMQQSQAETAPSP
ncbi:MAG: hypothetical protein PWQ57_292 [Desulfovibrionales bacterium]|nr:hypothetical protein [Desulfovibrionales bacterium]